VSERSLTGARNEKSSFRRRSRQTQSRNRDSRPPPRGQGRHHGFDNQENCRFLEEYPGIYRILFSDELYAEDRPLFDQFKGGMLGLKNQVGAIIEKGIHSGEFRSDVDTEKSSGDREKTKFGVFRDAGQVYLGFKLDF
jgi:hypothetical protein